MNHNLLVINMHAVVRDKHAGRSAIPLRINELIKRVHRRQPPCPNLFRVLNRERRIQNSAPHLGPISPRPTQSVRKRNRSLRTHQTRRSNGNNELQPTHFHHFTTKS